MIFLSRLLWLQNFLKKKVCMYVSVCVCVLVYLLLSVSVSVCVSLGEECVSVEVQQEGLVHDKTFMRTTTGTLCLSDSV